MTALRSGDWVMTGGSTLRNWIMAGGKYKLGNSITVPVSKASLKWPEGIEFLKGIIGQRVVR
jgi:hypothetical protein